MSETKDTENESANSEASSESEPRCAEASEGEQTKSESDSEPCCGPSSETESESSESVEVDALKEELEALRSKVEDTEIALADAKQDVDYAKAETQTALRRGREDTARAVARAKRDLMNRLINVADTFHMTTTELSKLEKSEEIDVISTAVEMAIKEFDKTLKGEGLEKLDPVGEAFDPQFHEAQANIPMPDKEPGSIVEVLRIGYLFEGTLLRAPQVVVAAKMPAPEPDQDEEKAED